MTEGRRPLRLCVFLGSSLGRLPVYRAAAEAFGTLLARRGIGLVYGGGTIGLLDVAGFYSRMSTFIDHVVVEKFLQPRHRAMLLIEREPEMMLDRMAAYLAPPTEHCAVSDWRRSHPCRSSG